MDDICSWQIKELGWRSWKDAGLDESSESARFAVPKVTGP